MLVIFGIIFVISAVFGGYALAGGKFAIIIKALPFEMLIIGGAGVGALITSNSGVILKGVGAGFKKLIAGPKWSQKDFQDILCLMFQLTRLMKTKGLIALEAHIENPKESSMFGEYPKIMADHFASDLICDTLRMVSMNLDNPGQVQGVMEKQITKHHHEASEPAHALHLTAEAFPALGIVAAVLGVIKTMASIAEPPEVLGGLIASALVGTFLGVFLSYGIAGPLSARLQQIVDEEGQFYKVIQAVIVAHLQGHAPQVSVEIGRGNLPSHVQPSFAEMEEVLNELPKPA